MQTGRLILRVTASSTLFFLLNVPHVFRQAPYRLRVMHFLVAEQSPVFALLR